MKMLSAFKPAKAEVHHESLLPQPVADQFGWPEMVREVAAIYNSLPPEERANTGIWAGNYGEAGAINVFGPAVRTAARLLSSPEPLVLGSAATGLQEPHRDRVEPRRRARQLHFVSGLRPLPAFWHGRGKHTDISLPRCPLRHPENLVALPPLELGKLGLGKIRGDIRQSFGSISFMAVILVHPAAYNDVTHLLKVSRLMLLPICFRIQIHIIDPSGTL